MPWIQTSKTTPKEETGISYKSYNSISPVEGSHTIIARFSVSSERHKKDAPAVQ